MSFKRGYKRRLPEEPDWRTREKRGNTGFSQMKTEKEKRMEAIKFCQRCFSHGHFTYECKNERIYQQRPSETQMLKHPKLAPVISLKTPPDLIEKRQKEREKLLKQSDELLNSDKKNANKDNKSGSESESYSYSYSYSDYSYSYSDYSEAEVDEKKEETKQENEVVEKKETEVSREEGRAPIPLLKKRTQYSSSEYSDYSDYSYSDYSYSDDEKKETKEIKPKQDLKRRRYSSSEYSDYSE